MNCPACGVLEARIVRTILGPELDMRQRKCRCGVTWNTSERIDRKSIRVVKVEGESRESAQPGHAIKRAADLPRESDLPELGLISPALSDPNPKASLLSEPRARGRKGRPSTEEYTPEFEAFWGSLRVRRGNKFPAFKAWVKVDAAISRELIFTRYQQWSATPQWQEGFPPYVSTWLNERGWDTEPSAADLRPRGGKTARSDGNIAELSAFLARGNG